MRINTAAIDGFGIKSMAGFGPGAWKLGSSTAAIPSRGRRSAKTARSQRDPHTVTSSRPVSIPASVVRTYPGVEPQAWVAQDLAVGSPLIVVCPPMMVL